MSTARRRRWPARLLILTLTGLLVWQGWYLGHVWWWRDHDPASTAFQRARAEALAAGQPARRIVQHWLPYDAISPHLVRAVVAAEDDRFLEHDGFDWTGIQQAIERNQRAGAPLAGGSTITQQLAKNLFLSAERSLLRKAQEAVITVMLETLWSKRRILEVYLNVVEWGEVEFGAEAAAQRQFGLSASRLGPAEAVRLAVMLPSPRRFARSLPPSRQRHAERVMARMSNSRIP